MRSKNVIYTKKGRNNIGQFDVMPQAETATSTSRQNLNQLEMREVSVWPTHPRFTAPLPTAEHRQTFKSGGFLKTDPDSLLKQLKVKNPGESLSQFVFTDYYCFYCLEVFTGEEQSVCRH
ncbi:hypothetical protein EXN66_Car010988 [Channa argus]|uniref:Uncharacterized protein n=1 Tax=Channa argus TaxID=215402 RepID=A0A6G1PYH2_CHAAH|nr:hypothetical protein EXN66_Car010988 [Channa argus]